MAFNLLNAATSTGVGEELTLAVVPKTHTLQCILTGSPTAVVLDLEGTLDSVTWFTLASHTFTAEELTAQAAMFHVVNKAVSAVRPNLQTLTGGTDPTVTVLYQPLQRK